MTALPADWPTPHPIVESVTDRGGGSWAVVLEGVTYHVDPSSDGITVSQDGLAICDRWFGIFMAIKDATTGPDTAWELLIPTADGLRDNLNFYHFRVLAGAAAIDRSGTRRTVAWEIDEWMPVYEAAADSD